MSELKIITFAPTNNMNNENYFVFFWLLAANIGRLQWKEKSHKKRNKVLFLVHILGLPQKALYNKEFKWKNGF